MIELRLFLFLREEYTSYNEEVSNMKLFIIFAVLVSLILIAVGILLDHMMAIFIVCIITCVLIQMLDRDKENKKPN